MGVQVGSIQPLLILFFSMAFSTFFTVFFMALAPFVRFYIFRVVEACGVNPKSAAFADFWLRLSFAFFGFALLCHDGKSFKNPP